MFVVAREKEEESSGRVQPSLLLLSCDGGGLPPIFFLFARVRGEEISWARGFFCVSQPAESVEARPSSKTGSKRETLFYSRLNLPSFLAIICV